MVDPNHKTLSKIKLRVNFNSFIVWKKCLVVKASEQERAVIVCVTSLVLTAFKGRRKGAGWSTGRIMELYTISLNLGWKI